MHLDEAALVSRLGPVVMTDAQITAACRRLGLPRPPTLPGHAARRAGSDVADTSSAPATPEMGDLLRTLAEPEEVLFVHRADNGLPVEIAVFALSPPFAVEQLPQMGASYALTLSDAGETLEWVVAYTRLSARSQSVAGSFEVSGSTWLEVRRRAATDLASALRLLRSDGVGRADREALGMALEGCERLAQVTVVRTPTTTRLEGTTISWFDSGKGGLWEIEAPKLASSGDRGEYGEALLERTRVTLRPTSKETLIGSIARSLQTRGSAKSPSG